MLRLCLVATFWLTLWINFYLSASKSSAVRISTNGTVWTGVKLEACNCSGHSRRCYFDAYLQNFTGTTGGGAAHCVDCADNRDGPNCQHCREGFYKDKSKNVCVRCNCNPKGSQSGTTCDQNGQCDCLPGVSGKLCDRCTVNSFNFTDYVGCSPCLCNTDGTIGNLNQCEQLEGYCPCKPQVDGHKCSQCKSGFFGLDREYEFGCAPCFCYGHTSECLEMPGYSVFRIEEDFRTGAHHWNATDQNGTEVKVYHSARHGHINVTTSSLTNLVFFNAPDRFLGNHIFSYNRHLRFSIQIKGQIRNPKATAQDVVIEGGDGKRISTPIFSQQNPIPSTNSAEKQHYTFRLHEQTDFGWTPQLTANEFIGLLANVTAIKIKATYTIGSVVLDDVSLESVTRHPVRSVPANSVARWVELCQCPEGYIGQHCESCDVGYRRYPRNGGRFDKCVKEV